MTEKVLVDHHLDLVGLYVAGGGISGVLTALRTKGRSESLIVVGYKLMDNVKTALLDGTLTLSIAHPLARLASETINGMVRAVTSPAENASHTRILPFDTFTRENL